MLIREMQSADIVEVSVLLADCFRWLSRQEGFNPTQRDFLLSRATPEVVREEAQTRLHLVACDGDGVILGMVVINGSSIARLYVRPSHHRQGVGRRLFEAAEERIRNAGFAEVEVGALVESAAAFYRSMGMHPAAIVEYEPEIFPDRPVTILKKSVR